MSFLNKNDVILFQGDSVTDCGRDWQNILSFGGGYPLFVAGYLSAVMPMYSKSWVCRF